MWFGPNCLWETIFLSESMIWYQKYAEMYFWPCVYNRKNVCCQSHFWTWPPVVVMLTLCFLSRCLLRNVWWCVTHKHPYKQWPSCLSTDIVLTAGYATHVWNYSMSSCRNIHNPYKFEEAYNLVSKGVSCERISRILYILSEHYVHGRKG